MKSTRPGIRNCTVLSPLSPKGQSVKEKAAIVSCLRETGRWRDAQRTLTGKEIHLCHPPAPRVCLSFLSGCNRPFFVSSPTFPTARRKTPPWVFHTRVKVNSSTKYHVGLSLRSGAKHTREREKKKKMHKHQHQHQRRRLPRCDMPQTTANRFDRSLTRSP